MIVKSGALKDRAVVLDLKDHERALVWVDGRFSHVLPPGLYAYWTTLREVAVEVIDARKVRFEHTDLQVIVRSAMAERLLDAFAVEQGHVGVLFEDGRYVETLPPGKYAFWKNMAKVTLVPVDLRETMLDIGGQEIMTADKVTLRLNAVVTYRVVDAQQARQRGRRRPPGPVPRGPVGPAGGDRRPGTRPVPGRQGRRGQGTGGASSGSGWLQLGLEVISVGIRDVILPGDMKDLMNKVTEAKKAAEANLIVRREETAAMRSQANTAKLLEGNPTLMRLRELEVLEKVASGGKLNVVLGEKGLAERVVNLL